MFIQSLRNMLLKLKTLFNRVAKVAIVLFVGACVVDSIWPETIIKRPIPTPGLESNLIGRVAPGPLGGFDSQTWLIENVSELNIVCYPPDLLLNSSDEELIDMTLALPGMGDDYLYYYFPSHSEIPVEFHLINLRHRQGDFKLSFSGCREFDLEIWTDNLVFSNIKQTETSWGAADFSAIAKNNSGKIIQNGIVYLIFMDSNRKEVDYQWCGRIENLESGSTGTALISCGMESLSEDSDSLIIKAWGVGSATSSERYQSPTLTPTSFVIQ